MNFDQRVIEVADARDASHKNSDGCFTSNKKDSHRIGAAGEWIFAKWFNIPYDIAEHTEHPEGDGGIDFTVYLTKHRYPLTIDVKTARNPYYLLVKDHLIGRGAQLLVLLAFDDATKACSFVGFEWRRVMAQMPVRTFGHPQKNYYRPREKLHQWGELCALMALRDGLAGPG